MKIKFEYIRGPVRTASFHTSFAKWLVDAPEKRLATALSVRHVRRQRHVDVERRVRDGRHVAACFAAAATVHLDGRHAPTQTLVVARACDAHVNNGRPSNNDRRRLRFFFKLSLNGFVIKNILNAIFFFFFFFINNSFK